MRLGMLLRWQFRLRSRSSPLRPTNRSSAPRRTGSAVRVIRRPCRIPSTPWAGSGTFEPGHPSRRFMSQTEVPPGLPIRDAPRLPPARIDSGRRPRVRFASLIFRRYFVAGCRECGGASREACRGVGQWLGGAAVKPAWPGVGPGGRSCGWLLNVTNPVLVEADRPGWQGPPGPPRQGLKSRGDHLRHVARRSTLLKYKQVDLLSISENLC